LLLGGGVYLTEELPVLYLLMGPTRLLLVATIRQFREFVPIYAKAQENLHWFLRQIDGSRLAVPGDGLCDLLLLLPGRRQRERLRCFLLSCIL
jgi:hypothetical protein